MLSDADDFNSSVRVVEFLKNGQNCGFSLTRGKWDPYPWVSNVDENSVSSLAGLKPGDCLLEVNGEDVVGQKISKIAELVKSKPDKVSLLLWNAGVDPHCSPEALCCGPIPNNLTRLSACMSSILAFLECPICLDTISPPTYQCDNGHLICIRCRAKSERCPVCRLRLSRGRSLVSDQVYNAVIDAFDLKEDANDIRSQKIQQIFKPKVKNTNIPNIKVTECYANKFLAKLAGKSSSVGNLSSNSTLLVPSQNDHLKMKSLSSSEIFNESTPTVSRVGSITRLGRRKYNDTTMDDSLTNISDFGDRASSCHGSFEFLNSNLENQQRNSICASSNDELSYYCPFDSKCTTLIKGVNFREHFQTNHTGPLIQYFGSSFEILLKNIENEMCFVVNNDSNIFFIKIVTVFDKADQENKKSDAILAWCWYLGPKVASKTFEMKLEVKESEAPLLRVVGSVFSLNATSFFDITEFKRGIFLSSKTINALGHIDQLSLSVNITCVDV
ncbi:hypothetical protein HUJ04_012462 [Dendroctonus ponderosae]|uniref:RING-type domain-containing protein n=1 Tax=Dendroctonus ponderosae TaxID=77166 RepID=A0AAR5PIB1_DENPD|nr:hypothetical protein HUJ04_012462 [Dendroctonus ponderosae]KAH1023217.1 hypothetical protein HUJ04_012462 [Dendroctonus ponderosae]